MMYIHQKIESPLRRLLASLLVVMYNADAMRLMEPQFIENPYFQKQIEEKAEV